MRRELPGYYILFYDGLIEPEKGFLYYFLLAAGKHVVLRLFP